MDAFATVKIDFKQYWMKRKLTFSMVGKYENKPNVSKGFSVQIQSIILRL